jgi:hypothetical protein
MRQMLPIAVQLVLRTLAGCWELAGGAGDFVLDERKPRRPVLRIAEHDGGAGRLAYRGWPGPVLIVNAASQLGRACLSGLAESRWTLFVGVSDLEEGARLSREQGSHVHPILLELGDPESVEWAIEEVRRITGWAPLAVVVLSDAALSVRSQHVFPTEQSPPRREMAPEEALVRLLFDADRLVFVSVQPRCVSTTALEASVRAAARLRAAGGERPLGLAWVRADGRRCPPARVSSAVEAALRAGPTSRLLGVRSGDRVLGTLTGALRRHRSPGHAELLFG